MKIRTGDAAYVKDVRNDYRTLVKSIRNTWKI